MIAEVPAQYMIGPYGCSTALSALIALGFVVWAVVEWRQVGVATSSTRWRCLHFLEAGLIGVSGLGLLAAILIVLAILNEIITNIDAANVWSFAMVILACASGLVAAILRLIRQLAEFRQTRRNL